MTLPELVRHRGGEGRVGGFSLVEMLVVVAILAVIALASAPWLTRMSRRKAVGSAAAEIQTTLLAARMRAVSRNAPASVVVVTAAPASASHRLDTIEPDVPAPTPTPLPARSLAISAGDVAFLTLPAAGKITFDGNGHRVAPGGSAPADIVIEGPTGSGVRNQVTIRTSLAGRVEVVTPAVWQ